MIPRTRLVIIVILIAAILIVGGLAYIWYSLTRPGVPLGPNPAVTLSPVQTSLDWPIALAFASDGRVFYAERNTGAIRIIENGSVLSTPFFTLSNTATAGERGLLGLALDPGFPANPWVYAYQTYNDAANASTYNRIVRIQASGDTGVSFSVILTLPPVSATVHNGGVIAFGPDGKLYAVVGEDGNPANSQDPLSPLGKVLRMNPDGSAPPDNPFSSNGSWNSLVYTYGHRNMFGLTFHPVTGRPYITENGPNCNDEVNGLIAGRNYGWGPSNTCSSPPPPPNNTNRDGPNPVLPLAWYSPTIAPTNAAFFTGSLLPQSRNDLIFGAWDGVQVDHRLHELRLSADGASVVNQTILATATEGILDVEMGHDGFLWVTTPTTIYRLVATPTIMSGVAMFTLAGFFAIALPLGEIADARHGGARSFATSGRGPSRKP